MGKRIKQPSRTVGRYVLKKTRKPEEIGDYVITSEDITTMAMQQGGNEMLEALDGLSTIIKGKDELENER